MTADASRLLLRSARRPRSGVARGIGGRRLPSGRRGLGRRAARRARARAACRGQLRRRAAPAAGRCAALAARRRRHHLGQRGDGHQRLRRRAPSWWHRQARGAAGAARGQRQGRRRSSSTARRRTPSTTWPRRPRSASASTDASPQGGRARRPRDAGGSRSARARRGRGAEPRGGRPPRRRPARDAALDARRHAGARHRADARRAGGASRAARPRTRERSRDIDFHSTVQASFDEWLTVASVGDGGDELQIRVPGADLSAGIRRRRELCHCSGRVRAAAEPASPIDRPARASRMIRPHAARLIVRGKPATDVSSGPRGSASARLEDSGRAHCLGSAPRSFARQRPGA